MRIKRLGYKELKGKIIVYTVWGILQLLLSVAIGVSGTILIFNGCFYFGSIALLSALVGTGIALICLLFRDNAKVILEIRRRK